MIKPLLISLAISLFTIANSLANLQEVVISDDQTKIKVHLTLDKNEKLSIYQCPPYGICTRIGSPYTIQEYQDVIIKQKTYNLGEDSSKSFKFGLYTGGAMVYTCVLILKTKCNKLLKKLRLRRKGRYNLMAATPLTTIAAAVEVDYLLTASEVTDEYKSHQLILQLFKEKDNIQAKSVNYDVTSVEQFISIISIMQMDIEYNK